MFLNGAGFFRRRFAFCVAHDPDLNGRVSAKRIAVFGKEHGDQEVSTTID
jgi:hypothetical protein